MKTKIIVQEDKRKLYLYPESDWDKQVISLLSTNNLATIHLNEVSNPYYQQDKIDKIESLEFTLKYDDTKI